MCFEVQSSVRGAIAGRLRLCDSPDRRTTGGGGVSSLTRMFYVLFGYEFKSLSWW